MIDRKEFANMRKQMEELDELCEDIFKQSRGVVRLSKKIIYSVHRGELKNASAITKDISLKIKKLRKNSRPEFLPQLRIAEQEFVEAICFYDFMRKGIIPSAKQLEVAPEHYLLGLCDLSGEMVRKAINSAIEGNDKLTLKIKDFLERVYDELMQFEFRNSELRRKFDSIKYDLKKLEDVALNIKRK
jgi:predicted translin family RNA/ssDNA-binding protein